MLPTASEMLAIAGDRPRPEVLLARERGHAARGSVTTSAATFVADDMNAVTGVGAPW